MAGSEHPEVIELSNLLKQLASHSSRPAEYKEAVDSLDEDARYRLRNSNGVAMKLANFAALDPKHPGIALSRGGKRDAAIWAEFAEDRDRLAQEAKVIRSRVAESSAPRS